jgi:hypothetical protein
MGIITSKPELKDYSVGFDLCYFFDSDLKEFLINSFNPSLVLQEIKNMDFNPWEANS